MRPDCPPAELQLPTPERRKRARSNAQKKKDATKQESRNKLNAAIEELTRVMTSGSGDFDTLRRRTACHGPTNPLENLSEELATL